MNLMIVESPNKIKKIKAILGEDWAVMASAGHIRDLPRKGLGVDQETLALTYEYIPPATVQGHTFPGGEERVARMRAALKDVRMVYLATDPDREGEAIAWHLKESLGLDESDYQRVTFDSITATAIQAALKQTRKIDMALVHAQEARRALDRLVGYRVSPVISDVLGMSLSAGRVQSPAVRLVVDRDRQIREFRRTSHFSAVVEFDGGTWSALWNTKPFISDDVPYVLDKTIALQAANCRTFKVTESESGTAKERPPSPFSTSLLLQAASVSLKLDPEVTAKLAQSLFEQGAITYIRTDSVNFSDEAVAEIRQFASAQGWAVPEKPHRFKTKGDAQEAHEAIRPTHLDERDCGETEPQKALYTLIWTRAVASQLAEAEYKTSILRLVSTEYETPFEFVARGRVLAKPGWRILTAKDAVVDDNDPAEEPEESAPENSTNAVPQLSVGTAKSADNGKVLNKETKPPARFTKASLIAKLESEGIGRPATYPAIMQNIMAKEYLSEDKRYLAPTSIGVSLVSELIKAGFGFMDLSFTRAMEDDLDQIAGGKRGYDSVVRPAYQQLQSELAHVAAAATPKFPCPKCGQGLRRYSPAGKLPLWACTNEGCKTYLNDVNGTPVPQQEHPCPACNSPLRRYRKQDGKPGWFCTGEDCKTFMDDKDGKPVKPPVHSCPKCKSPLQRYPKKDKETGKLKGGFGWFCTNKDCKTFMDDRAGNPVAQKAKSKK